MKGLLKIAMILMAVLTLTTACDKSESKPVYTSIVTIVDGTSSIPYYIVFDDGTTGYVSNSSVWTPTFPTGKDELRFMASYTKDDDTVPGFDLKVTLSQVISITTEDLEVVGESAFSGATGLDTFDAGIRVTEAYFTPYRDFFTIMVTFAGYSTEAKHTIRLVRNTSSLGKFKSEYGDIDDGYLWLELYHDDDDDGSEYLASAWASFKINEVDPAIGPMTKYKGIKVISSDLNNPKISNVFTLDFAANNIPTM